MEAQQRQDQQAKLNSVIKSAGLSPRHLFTFEDFFALPDELRKDKEHAAELCYLLATEGKLAIEGVWKFGLCLHGTFGVGKTTLTTSALIEAAQRGTPILRVKFADFLDDVWDAYGNRNGNGPKADDLVREAQNAPVVLLDDMGDPKSRDELHPDKRRITHKLLEWRNEYCLTTFITTNCDQDLLEKQLTKRTFERVQELCHFEEVKGPNLRKK